MRSLVICQTWIRRTLLVLMVSLVEYLKECSSAIASSLYVFFNQSLSTGPVPCEWKSADVTPVYERIIKKLLITTGQYHSYQSSSKSWIALRLYPTI